jgi:hypothetical protein
MEMVTVSCNSCGAPLKVGAQVRFVTCQFCNSQLEIKRNDSTIFTDQIDRIADHTAQMAQNLEAIKLQNEIEMLDRQAAVGSAQSGRADASNARGGGVLGMAFAVFFAFVCFAMAATAGKSGAPGLFALVPVGMGIFALVAAGMGLAKSSEQANRQDEIRQRRDDLARRLNDLNAQPKGDVEGDKQKPETNAPP